jgi:hemoglobin/transferrin/lactoferrin receptor protein
VAFEALSRIGDVDFTYGFDYYRDCVNSFRNNFNAMGGLTSMGVQGPVADDASYDLAGLFVQAEVPLGESFSAILGARLTYASFVADQIADPMSGTIRDSDHWWSLVGSARVMWHVDDNTRVFGGVSQGFRAPNLSDISRLDTALSNEIETPTSGLDPEDFLAFELGARYLYDGFSIGAAFSYTILDDLIIRQPTGELGMSGETLVRKRNAGDGHVLAFDLEASVELSDAFEVFGTFSWVDGQVETYPTSSSILKTEALGKLSPLHGSLGIAYRTEDRRWRFSTYGVAAARQDRINSQDGRDTQRIPPNGTPGWITLNAEASFSPTPEKRFFLAVENILDKNYRLHGSGVQEPGLNVILGCDLTF